jgi:hypothetical protein
MSFSHFEEGEEAGLPTRYCFHMIDLTKGDREKGTAPISVSYRNSEINGTVPFSTFSTLWLAKNGLGFGQLALLGYLLSDTKEEHQVWKRIQESHALRKIAFAALLKTLLPIEAMISAGFERAQIFKDQWDEVYGWLSDAERKELSLLARSIMNLEVKTFQERLEQAAFQLITNTCL